MMAPATNLNVIKNPKFMLPPFISEKASSVSLVYISLPHNFKQKNSNMMIALSISLISILQSNRMFFCLFFLLAMSWSGEGIQQKVFRSGIRIQKKSGKIDFSPFFKIFHYKIFLQKSLNFVSTNSGNIKLFFQIQYHANANPHTHSKFT